MQRALLALLALLVPLAARAGEPPAPDWSPSIETVVVTAQVAEPLMWRVTKANATVYLLGIVEPLPNDLEWNDAGVRKALKGARQLLLPPKASVGILEGIWYLAWHSADLYLPRETPMESTLPAPLRARFAAWREKIGRGADRYARLRPPLAGLRLEGDFLKARGLTQDEPAAALKRIARLYGVPARPIADYEAIPMLKQLPAMSKAANEGCVKALLDDVDVISERAEPAARAWAAGDLGALKAAFSEQRFESCIQALPSFAALARRSVDDSLKAVEGALGHPGHSLIAISVGTLLRKGGIIDRLDAGGFRVEQPGTWEPDGAP